MAATEQLELLHICPECGRGFPTARGLVTHAVAIHNVAHPSYISMKCRQCGKEIERVPSQMPPGGSYSEGPFCSQSCQHQWRSIYLRGTNSPQYGHKCSEQTKRKISEALTGRTLSAERCRAMSRVQRGKKNHFYGRQHSEESKHKISVAKTGKRTRTPESYRKTGQSLTGENHWNWKGGLVTVSCDYCRQPIKVAPSLLRQRTHHFCNRECYNYWTNDPGTVPCDYCGNPVTIPHCILKKQEHFFCNRQCYIQWYKQNIVGGEQNWNWRGGPIPYGPLWPTQRDRARNRDNYTCQLCGITEGELGHELSVHHIRPFRESGDNSLENLICLCDKKDSGCHYHCEENPGDCPQPRRSWLLTV